MSESELTMLRFLLSLFGGAPVHAIMLRFVFKDIILREEEHSIKVFGCMVISLLTSVISIILLYLLFTYLFDLKLYYM